MAATRLLQLLVPYLTPKKRFDLRLVCREWQHHIDDSQWGLSYISDFLQAWDVLLALNAPLECAPAGSGALSWLQLAHCAAAQRAAVIKVTETDVEPRRGRTVCVDLALSKAPSDLLREMRGELFRLPSLCSSDAAFALVSRMLEEHLTRRYHIWSATTVDKYANCNAKQTAAQSTQRVRPAAAVAELIKLRYRDHLIHHPAEVMEWSSGRPVTSLPNLKSVLSLRFGPPLSSKDGPSDYPQSDILRDDGLYHKLLSRQLHYLQEYLVRYVKPVLCSGNVESLHVLYDLDLGVNRGLLQIVGPCHKVVIELQSAIETPAVEEAPRLLPVFFGGVCMV